MDAALHHLRKQLAGHFADRAEFRRTERRARHCDFDAQQRARGAYFSSGAAGDALLEIQESALLDPEAWQRLAWQVGSAQAGLAGAVSDRQRWAVTGRPLDQPPEPASMRLLRAMSDPNQRRQQLGVRQVLHALEGSADGWLSPHPVAVANLSAVPSVTADTVVALTDRFLEATADPFEGLLADLATGEGTPAGGTAPWLRAVLGDCTDGTFSLKERGRKLTALFGQVGLAGPLTRSVRWAPDTVTVLPWPAFEIADPIGDVRVYQGAIATGLLAELAALQAVAAAVFVVGAQPDLPIEDCWPLPGSACHTVGGLFSQLVAERSFLASSYGLSGSALERAQKRGLFVWLFVTRLACAWTGLMLRAPAAGGEQRLDTLRQALRCDCEPGAVDLCAAPLDAALPVAVGAVSGAALHLGMRERFDEDYFRNPRFGQYLAATGLSGARLTGTKLMEDSGVCAQDSSSRLAEFW